MKKNTNLIIVAAIALLIGAGAGFFGGMTYQKGKAPQSGDQGGRFQGRNGGNGARPVVGEILTIDDRGMTIKLQDGSTKIVLVSDKTSINKAAQATKDDLKTGERVSAFGMQNPDGSVSATNVQLNPQMFRGGTATSSPSPAN